MAIAIKLIENSDIWEQFIRQYAPSALFQSWLWGAVEKKRGMHVMRFGMYEEDTLVGIYQTIKVRAKRGTFIHVRHGPILADQTKTTWMHVVSHLKKYAREEGAWFVRISPQITDSLENQELLKSLGMQPAAIHAMDGEDCWVLDITPNEEELLAQMRKTTRYEIRRAQKLGVKVRISTSLSDMKHFHALYKQTSARQRFVPHSGIDEEFGIWAQNNNAILLMAEHDGKTLATSIILFYGSHAIYHHSASIPSHVPASHLLQWHAILEAKKRGNLVYNFWGIAPDDKPNHPWRGITLFKKGFGGREIKFIHAHDLPVSPLYSISRTIELYRRMKKKY